ncbi:MAG: hypothetical protein KIT76_00255 [Pseudolabrys sp.]|nr:hypothetical protein [Pseudolabrys sp.]
MLLAGLSVAAVALAQSREDYRSAGQEKWVRFEFRLKDAASGEPVSGRVFYQSDLASRWFHPDNYQPLLPPGTYRLVGWERNYWQTEEVLVVDPSKGLRQQKTISLQLAAPKRNDASRLVPDILSGLVVVGNAAQKMPHMNRSWFSHNNIGNFTLYFNAWSEFPGGPNGIRISSATVEYEITHNAQATKERFDFFRQFFKQGASSSQRVVGPVPVALGDEALQISADTPWGGGRTGNVNESRRYLIRSGNVLLKITLGRNPDAPFLTSPQDLLARVRALDMQRVKRILEPEPFPWPEKEPRAGASSATASPPGAGTSASTAAPPGSEPPTEAENEPETPEATEQSDSELTPAEIAAVSALAGGAALLGSLTMFGMTGVRREEVLQSIRDLLRGRLPEDPYDVWRRKYEALGWKYSEKDGVGTFDPVDGARNEAGEIYSAERGGFVREGEGSRVLMPAKDGDVNERGDVWSENDGAWVQRAYWDQERARRSELEARRADETAEAERISREESQAYSQETARLADKIAADRAARAAAEAAEAAQRDRIVTKLRNACATEDGDPAEIDRLTAAGDTEGLKQLYADHLKRVVDASSADAAAQKHWADVMAAGEYASKLTLAAAKTGMMVVAGPAGTLAVATGLGTIGSFEEGARAWVAGEKPIRIAGAFATGFLSGAKDGAVGRYVNLPKVPALTKVLLPAGVDAGEAYVRSGGDVKTALQAGALSAFGGAVGQKVGNIDKTVTREGAQLLLGGAMGAAGRAASDGNLAEGFVDGLVGSVGSSAGGRIANAATPMTKLQIQMDKEAAANAAKGKSLVEELKQAVTHGTPEEQKAAVNRVLENRDAKLLLKGDGVDNDTKVAFATLTEEHRTKPLFEQTAAHLNGQRVTKDGVTANRFVVVEPDGVTERPVRPSDFKSGSGSAGNAPGMDLDMYAGAKIIDKQTGRPARPEELQKAVAETCDKLGISKSQQEINVIHGTHVEAFTMRPGETPQDFLARARAAQISGAEGRSVSEVTGVKLAEATVLHKGNTGAGAVSEQCRTAIKDYDRITRQMMENTPGSRLPLVFTTRNAVTGETPMDIMRAVHDGRMTPGTADAKFRAATGMSLSAGAEKLAQMPEFIAKFGASGTTPAAGPTVTYPPGMHPRDIAGAALRQALRLGSDDPQRPQ